MGKREIGPSLVVAAVTAYAATLAPTSTRIVAYCVAALGGIFIIWDAIQRQDRRRNGKASKHSKTELVIVHKRTYAEIKGYGFPFNSQYLSENGGVGLMDITCVCFVSVPERLPTVQLLSGVAKIEVDGKRYEEEVRISQTIVPWNTNDYRIPPFVNPSETLQIDVEFFGKVLWDNGWVHPNKCKIRELVLIDQFKKKHRLKEEILFHPSWV
ncbi:MAG: hypothetical protein KGL05_03560, partial [Acidobacteriota bacterium]|nr:hypothetical protein [Acidobacteriota bacterium]